MENGAQMTAATPREHLAWLIWCYGQGYANLAGRAILTNWMGDDPAARTSL